MSDAAINPIAITDTAAFTSAFRPLFSGADIAPDSSSADRSTAGISPGEDYDRGFADGERAAEATFSADQIAVRKLITNLQAHESEPSDELGQLIAATVETLVRQIVGAFEPDANWLRGKIDAAVQLISDCDAARSIALHPDDYALLADDTATGNLTADPAMDRGSIRIDCSQGWIESGHALYLDELNAALGLSGEAR